MTARDDYPSHEQTFAAADSRIELAQQLLAGAEPVVEGDPAWLYLTKTRKLLADAVRAALAELRHLPPPIEGRPPQDHAVVSLLRDSNGDASGIQLTFVDVLGTTSGTAPKRQTYSLRPHGCRDGLFRAGCATGPRCYLTEGRLEKSIAAASLGIGPTYGGGGLNVLGFAVPPEPAIVLVPDRAPPPDAWAADGKERLLDLHNAAYERAVDRMILAGKTVLLAPPPDCAHKACKDADAYLIAHGPIGMLLLLTGLRRSEVACARWSELDLAAAVLRVPGERMKGGRTHDAPLPPAAIEILRGLPRLAGSDLVFPGRSGDRPVAGFTYALKRAQAASGTASWSWHDCRRTVRSGLGRLGVRPDIAERVLAHTVGNAVQGELFEPHSGRRIGLGTREVAAYHASWTNGYDLGDTDITIGDWAPFTSGPRNRFGAALIIEKGGIADIARQVGLGERFDLVVIGNEGQSPAAELRLVDALGPAGVPVFLLTDFDRQGFTIAQNLRGGTWRHRYATPPKVVHRLVEAEATITRLVGGRIP